jgi:hypothetical protein
MPNMVVCTQCNRSCPYCFAMDSAASAPDLRMSFAEVVAIADAVAASKQPAVGVLGGEPTLHPEFCQIVEYLVRRGLRPTVFTNGLCSESVMGSLDAMRDVLEEVDFVVNVNAPGVDPPATIDRQDEFLRRFATRCRMSVNIFRLDIDPLYAIDVAKRTGLRRGPIRVGLAQPALEGHNECLRLEDYERAAALITRLGRASGEMGLPLNLDCGFPLCSFTDEQLGVLLRHGTRPRFYCRPAVDFGPGGETWACFPLWNTIRTTVEPPLACEELYQDFVERRDALRAETGAWLFPQCDGCLQRRIGTCEGGCLAHTLALRAQTADAGPRALPGTEPDSRAR